MRQTGSSRFCSAMRNLGFLLGFIDGSGVICSLRSIEMSSSGKLSGWVGEASVAAAIHVALRGRPDPADYLSTKPEGKSCRTSPASTVPASARFG